jgi:hypothetical protein
MIEHYFSTYPTYYLAFLGVAVALVIAIYFGQRK